jgi:integrase
MPRARRWRITFKRPKHKPRPFEHGVDVRLVKDLLGHEDIKSTVIYTQVTDAALSAAVLRLSSSL